MWSCDTHQASLLTQRLSCPLRPQPDRTPHPALYEVKAVYAQIKMSFMQGTPGPDGAMSLRVLIRNRYFWLSTSWLRFEMQARGRVLDAGPLAHGVGACASVWG